LIETITEALTQAKLTKLIHLSAYLGHDLLHYHAEPCARSNDLPKAVRMSGNSKLADIMPWPAFLDTPEFCRHSGSSRISKPREKT